MHGLLALLSVSSAFAASPAFEQLLQLAIPETLPAITRVVFTPAPRCVFDGRTGLPAPWADVLSRARAAEVVFAGEQHDSAKDHAGQVELLQALQSADPRATAGFEMLYADQQGSLDAYLSGAIDAAAFQQAVDWKKTWGFPFPLYQPVFDALRATSRRGAALNVPKRIVDKVSFLGLASLTPAEQAYVPAGFTRPTDPAYLAMLAETFKAHNGDPSDPIPFGNFVDAMTLWNEGMSDALARYVSSKGGPVLVVAGAFHAFGPAIPAGLERRRPGTRQLSVVFRDLSSCPASLAPADLSLSADYYWVP